jgi:uncharacterized membrane protein
VARNSPLKVNKLGVAGLNLSHCIYNVMSLMLTGTNMYILMYKFTKILEMSLPFPALKIILVVIKALK